MSLAAREAAARRTGPLPEKRALLIAIVDDDEAVLRAMTRLLRTGGMTARTFTNGEDFLELVESIPSFAPDCVILDVRLAGTSGLEVHERLMRAGRTLPVIFMTGYDEPAARVRALGSGAVAFLRKPFRSELLFEALQTATGRPPAG
jgi:FixJ family two-component response regulator